MSIWRWPAGRAEVLSVDDDAPPVTKRPELHLDSQTLDELFAPELWSALAPGLDGSDDAVPFEVAAGDGEKLRAALAADGFVAVERPPPWCVDVSRLARAAASLSAHGFPPGFLLAYEASWRLQAQLSTVISTATGGNVATGDAIAFHFGVVHGARGNPGAGRRRAFSLRLVGDDARYVSRPGRTSPPFPGHGMVDGDRLRSDWFPALIGSIS